VLVEEIGGVVPKFRGQLITQQEALRYNVAHLLAKGWVEGTGPDLPPAATVGPGLTGIAAWDEAKVYQAGQVVTDEGASYACTVATTTPGTHPAADSDHWLALGSGGGGGASAGTPTLYGPFTIDYSAIRHDGDTKTLWTPMAGDAVLALYFDLATRVAFARTNATFRLGQDTSSDDAAWLADTDGGDPVNFTLPNGFKRLWLLRSADPIQIRYVANGDGDLTIGHVELYALIARPVAPS
jgi:hypothetical protein